MGRPRTPLLSRKRVAEAALAIVDESGLDALSLERLAEDLGVRAPSLYYHFRDKAEILAEVARRLLMKAPIPERRDDVPWVEWFVQLSLSARAVILEHRNAAPLLHQFLARDLLVGLYDNSARYLEEAGIPPEQHVLVIEGLETLTISGAVAEAASGDGTRAVFSHLDPDEHPTLARAQAANPWSADELFAQSIRRFLTGTTDPIPAPARRTRTRSARTSGRRTSAEKTGTTKATTEPSKQRGTTKSAAKRAASR